MPILFLKGFSMKKWILSALLMSLSINSSADYRGWSTDISNTPVKWQSIGNCWAYATMSWIEALALNGSDGKLVLNISESYHTYRDWELKLLRSRGAMTEIDTAGSFSSSIHILEKFGMMNEGDFIPHEENLTKSDIQLKALEYMNLSLKSGALKNDRSPETIRAELDNAFQVNLENLKDRILPLNSVVVKQSENGGTVTLDEEMQKWGEVSWPQELNKISDQKLLPLMPTEMSPNRQNILKRLKRALKDGHPVMVVWLVDFNALGQGGIFSANNLRGRGPGTNGFHMVVMEDYVAHGIDPATGNPFFSGEGKVSPELQNLATEYGNIDYFIVKNSWGGSERPDRPSYYVNGQGGFHRLEADYLLGWINFGYSALSPLQAFVLPKGY